MKRVLLMSDKHCDIEAHLWKIRRSVVIFNLLMLFCIISYWIVIILLYYYRSYFHLLASSPQIEIK